MESILYQGRSIIVGDRGAGKSAIFRKLAAHTSSGDDPQRLEIYALSNTGDLLHRVVDKDAWLDADALRAAW
jgi:ABC-type phosphate/phosphonate transport system ATPase subunit